MASHKRRDRRKRRDSITQAPWSEVKNTIPSIELLTPTQLEEIHLGSMSILEELGIELMSERARRVFAEAGAEVDDASATVRVGRETIMAALKTAPSEFELTPRNPEKRIKLGGDNVAFGLVAGPPSVHDEVRGRRSGNMEDYKDLLRLAHHFNAIHVIGNQVTPPVELPANTRHLDCYMANIALTDIAFHCTAIGAGRARDGIEMMAISRGESVEDMEAKPGVITIINVNSPRRFDAEMAEGLLTMAEHGQAVVVTPFTLMGAMTPVSLGAALVQQNAEALFGIALAQLAKPGAPVMYGAFTSNVDMRTGSPAFGTPENTKANIAAGQLARYYQLPYRSSNASASNVVDAQAAYETQMSLWGAVLGGANLIYHAAGWMEGGLQVSFEKLVIDVEMLQQMVEVMRPIDTSPNELALEAIARIPPGGHFFGDPHTLARYQDAFYTPLVSDWQSWENWADSGGSTATQRATAMWKRALDEYEQPVLEPDVMRELNAYVSRRKDEIGNGEP